MRRLLAIVLLVFMPLQFSWAAVESYCALEAQVEAEHFGHHEHLQHVADTGDRAGSADTGDSSAPAASDTDCSHCHGHGPAMLGDVAAARHQPSNARPSAAPDEAGHAHASARPERPQWLRLA